MLARELHRDLGHDPARGENSARAKRARYGRIEMRAAQRAG